jgi:hypothetical protein
MNMILKNIISHAHHSAGLVPVELRGVDPQCYGGCPRSGAEGRLCGNKGQGFVGTKPQTI